MMIKCEQHGFNEAIQVSPDLKKRINASKKIKDYILVHYEYNDEIAETFFLSIEYATKYKLQNNNILPLPDDYPKWVKALVLICKKCFETCSKS